MAHVTKSFERKNKIKKVSPLEIVLLDDGDGISLMRNAKEIEPIPKPSDDFIQVLQCDDKTLFYYFENSGGNSLQGEVECDFMMTHLKIPLKFERVLIKKILRNGVAGYDFNITGSQEIKGVRMDSSDKKYSYMGYFAIGMNRVDIGIDPNLQHAGSRLGCGTTLNNSLGGDNNFEQSIFKYKQSYMIPIVMETGLSLYHRFSVNDENLNRILDEVINKKQTKVGFDTPLTFHKTLGIYYVKQASYS